MNDYNQEKETSKLKKWLQILLVSTRLGLTSFGGPIAHLGYFHEEYVRKKKWLNEQNYSDLVALSQFLPGPASSQVGIGIGIIRGGIIGGIISFLGFTLPSVLALIVFAILINQGIVDDSGWIHGLKIVAVVIVAHAILGMAKNLTPDTKRKLIALFALLLTLLWPNLFAQMIGIVLSAFIGFLLYKNVNQSDSTQTTSIYPISKKWALICLSIFFGLLLFLPILKELTSIQWIAMFDSFYRSGSLVFGGGHVVLPLLEKEFVPSGMISAEDFLAGYGATQAVPGPLFTFAAYIGTIMGGWSGGLLATFAIFLPAFLLILGTLPFWDILRQHSKLKGALMGINAAVVGILISAFYAPIWTSAIVSPVDFALAAVLFSLLVFLKQPPWLIVIIGALAGFIIYGF
ncbi:chromate efflux transporter [Alkalihalobacillus trypoxylicola]|uniref:ChrA protein n=1 Tax=Alkalihalobacillus trypoxylicola TaxID=519424 RepID=A0A162ENP9_9BACI|nr:chromate efflux transporter [Alkalihalobacillus trypoxylicola]KYG33356.1 ChrA protein [Alkalihalobacillus trypoxylicola]